MQTEEVALTEGSPVLTWKVLERDFGPFKEGPPKWCFWHSLMHEVTIVTQANVGFCSLVTDDWAGRLCTLHEHSDPTGLAVGLKFCGLDRLSDEQWRELLKAKGEQGELPLRRVLEVMQEARIFIESQGVRNWFTAAFLWVGREENAGRAPMIPREVWEAARIHPR